MKKLVIAFDVASLVIPDADYELFKDENYYIDDGTSHFFNEEDNCLLILDTEKKFDCIIYFSEVTLEGNKKYEITGILKTLKKDISPQTNLKKAREEVLSIIEETFDLLDGILKKRAQPDSDLKSFGFKYYVLNKQTHAYGIAIGLKDRFSYLQFIPRLDYGFNIVED